MATPAPSPIFPTPAAPGLRRRSARSWQPPALLALLSALSLTLACGGGGGQGASAAVRTAPQIQTFGPTSGAPNTVVTIEGTGFTGVTQVTFGTVAAATFSAANGGLRLTATVPAGATSGPIQVTTSGGTATSTASFTVLAAPQVAPALPAVTGFAQAEAGPGEVVTLTGTGFTGLLQVAFNGVPATEILSSSSTEIRVRVPQGASTGPVTVVTPAGSADSASAFTVRALPVVPAAPPAITGFTPASGPVGTRVTLTGARFSDPVQVDFHGVASPIRAQVLSATEVIATVPAGASTGPITLGTGAGSAVSAQPFTVTAAAPLALTGFTPASGPEGAAVVLTGTGFTGALQVQFNGVASPLPPQVDSDTQITASVPAGAGTGPITVVVPAGSLTSAGTFAGPAPAGPAPALPALTTVSPASARPGATVTLTGSGLAGALQVTFNGVAARVIDPRSDTVLTAEVPAAASSGPVQVTTPAGGTVTGLPFTVEAPLPAPTVTTIAPPAAAPGSTVTLTGTGFAPPLTVTFGGEAAGAATVSSDGTSAQVVVPGSAAAGPVTVITAGGDAAGAFGLLQPAATLAITGLSRYSGPAGGTVVITGTALDQGQGVYFGGVLASSRLDSPTQITAEIPENGNGLVGIFTASAGEVLAPGGAFTVTPSTVAIAGYTPDRGGPGSEVTLIGTGFSGVTQVEYAGEPLDAAGFDVDGDQRIRVRIPDLASGDGRIRLIGATGVASTARPIQFIPGRITAINAPLSATLATQQRPGGAVQLRLLDFPAPNRSSLNAHTGIRFPKAPVLHPQDPLPADGAGLRPGKAMPTFSLNFKLPAVFYPALPAEVRFVLNHHGVDPAQVDIFVVSEDYAYTGTGAAAYQLRPHYWTDPDAPDVAAEGLAGLHYETGSQVQVGLYGQEVLDGVRPPLLADARGHDLMTADLFLEPDASPAPGPYLALESSNLAVLNLDPSQNTSFWSVTVLNGRAAATLHLMLNDATQRALETAAQTADTLDELFTSLDAVTFQGGTIIGFQKLIGLSRPQVTDILREQRPEFPGEDLITLTGSGFSGIDNPRDVTINGSDPIIALIPVSDAILKFRVATGTTGRIFLFSPHGIESTYLQ